MSVLKLSHKVCIVAAWVEGGCETDAQRARRGRGGRVEETVRAQVAPGVGLDGTRRSEKAEVPEKTGAETSAGCEASQKKNTHTPCIARSCA